jgi:hypothetical protein
MDFDAALANGGALVAAWDDFDDDRKTLALFEVGDKGAKRLAETSVPRDQHQQRADELVALGVRLGYTVGNNEHVWAIDDDVTVWSSTGVELDGNRATLKLAGQFVPPGDVGRVIAFYSRDRVQRGVRLETKTKQLVAASEHDDDAKDDPFYNQDNLVIDAMWASYLANDLATWLGVPLDDQLMHIDNASQVRIAKVARELAAVTTAEAMQSIGTIESLGEVKLRVAPNPAGDAYLEVIVSPPGGKVGSRWIRQGTREQIAATLRSVRLPRLVLDTASAILDQQRR